MVEYLSGGRIQGLASEKSAISDIPAQTRYEETDTRKIYRWSGTAWIERGVAS